MFGERIFCSARLTPYIGGAPYRSTTVAILAQGLNGLVVFGAELLLVPHVNMQIVIMVFVMQFAKGAAEWKCHSGPANAICTDAWTYAKCCEGWRNDPGKRTCRAGYSVEVRSPCGKFLGGDVMGFACCREEGGGSAAESGSGSGFEPTAGNSGSGNQCVCNAGTAATGNLCPANGALACVSCHAGYSLPGGVGQCVQEEHDASVAWRSSTPASLALATALIMFAL